MEEEHMTPMTKRIKTEIGLLNASEKQYMAKKLDEDEYVSEVRQLAINLLLVIDEHISLDNYIPAKDIEYRVKEGN
jgi:hypothetical protein